MELRGGTLGSYYGSTINSSSSLTTEQMKVNAAYISKFLTAAGWTINAICGMLGNMQAESSLNPGRWQSEDVGNTSLGYGLVQWTPATKYLDWCNANNITDPSEMDSNLRRIIYELQNNIQWIPTDEYNLSFEEFSKSSEDVEYLASAFLKCYERAGVEVEETRKSNARAWYELYISGDLPTNPSVKPTTKKKKKFNFILFNKNRRLV